MNLNLKQLETFLCIVRLGSFGAAAEHLHATQSTVSVRIHELEQTLGVEVLDRTRRRVYLTPQGRALVPRAEKLLAFASQVHQEVGDLRAMHGIVRVGVCEPIALTWLPKFIAACRRNYPKMNIEIDKDLTTGLTAKLQRGEVDVALIAGPVTDETLIAESLGCIEFSWVAGLGFAVPQGPLTPHEIRQLPLISLSQQPYQYPAIERWLGGVPDHDFVVTCNDIDLIIRLVTEGVGISLLATICCSSDINQGRIRILDTSPGVPSVEFFAVSRKNDHQPLISSIVSLAGELSAFSKIKGGGRRRSVGTAMI